MKLNLTLFLIGLVVAVAMSQQVKVDKQVPLNAQKEVNGQRLKKKGWWGKVKKFFSPPKIKIPKFIKKFIAKIPKFIIPKIPKINIPKIPKINIPKINIPKIPKINIPNLDLLKLLKIKAQKDKDEAPKKIGEEEKGKGEEKKKKKKEKEEKDGKDLEENDENVSKKKDESSDRQYCDVIMKKDDIKVEIEKKMVDMKYLKGKINVVATVQSKDKECHLLEVSKCSSTSRNILTRSAYFKVVNMMEGKLRFGFHFFVGINREMGLCSVRVAMKNSKEAFEDREKVMSYFPSEEFDVSKFTNQKSFGSSQVVFEGMTTQQALEMCAAPFEKSQKMLISNFYQTFEGFMLSESQAGETKFKCEKNVKQNDVLFRAVNEAGLKKVDVFVNNKEYTLIAIKNEQTKVKISEKKIEDAKRGSNLDAGVKTFSFQVLGLSYYNFQNNQCYDLDRKNVAKSWVKSSYNPSVSDNNSEFNFDVAVMAEEGPSGTLCAVYGLFPVAAEDDKFFIQNDLLVKFKSGQEPITNENCATMLQNLSKPGSTFEMYNQVENRFLGGAIINSLANADHKVYCQIDVRDNIARDQFRADQYNRIFYETAVVQFMDNNNEDQVNSVIAAQIEAAQKRIESYQEIQAVLPSFHTMPYDIVTRQDAKDKLLAGETLNNMDFIRSSNGHFAAVLKNDNKLCVYLIQSKDGLTQKLWCSASASSEAGKGVLKLATTGELSIVNQATQAKIFTASESGAGEGFFLVMQNDGNLCSYNKENALQWSSNSFQNANYFQMDSTLIVDRVKAPFTSKFGLILRSANNKYILELDVDGAFQIRKRSQEEPSGKPIWGNSASMDVSYLFTMHMDLEANGNLVQYSEDGQKGMAWDTKSSDKQVTHMELTDTGALQLITDSGAIIWFDGMMPNDLWSGPAENILKQGDSLNAQQFLRSENGRFVAILKDDLSLVVYMRKEDGSDMEIFNNKMTSTGQNLGTLSIGSSGEVIVTDTTEGKEIFTSPTKKTGSLYHLRMQNDGSLASLDEKMEVQWATEVATFVNQMEAGIPEEVAAPFTSYRGYFMRSPNKKCMMILNPNGALSIVDETGKTHWQTNTDLGLEGAAERFVSFVEDGEFSLYLNENTQSWVATDSKQELPDTFKMTMTNTCQVEIKGKSGEVTWNPFQMKKAIFTSATSKLMAGQSLSANECLNDFNNMYAACMSPMGALTINMKMETDGKFKEAWTSETTCEIAEACVLRMVDNNFEIYDNINKKQIKLLKNSQATYFIMQNDGNSCAYDSNHSYQWGTATQMNFQVPPDSNAYPNKVVKSHKWLQGGAILVSTNKKHLVVYQWDGNVVIQSGSSAVAITGTNYNINQNPNQFFILQNDGNLVFYLSNGQAKWSTQKMTGHAVQILDDGDFQVVDSSDNVIWSKKISRRLQSLGNKGDSGKKGDSTKKQQKVL